MINFIVVGKCKRVTSAVLQAIRSFTDAKCVVIGGPETRLFRWSWLCKRQMTIELDGRDDSLFIEAVQAIRSRTPHVILVPVDCDGIRLVNRVRGQLPVAVTPVPDTITLDMFDNKWRFHQFCTVHGLAVPATRHVASKSAIDFDAIAAEIGLPFVVKPLNLAGSAGVQVVHHRHAFEQGILHNARYDYGPLIVQRYIDGEDIDISFLAIGGRITAFAIQQTEEAYIRFRPHAELESLAAQLCAAGGFHGVMHVDARIEAATGKVYLIESNPRFWASLTACVWGGLNFVAESIVPAARTEGMRRLVAGAVNMRNPLIRPSAWRQLARDTSARGRLLRTVAFDPPSLGAFVSELPLACWRFVVKRATGLPKRRANDAQGSVAATRTSLADHADVAAADSDLMKEPA
ncbi:hypothetical protein GCM10027343_42140 [Noviherbaspirillum agri]